MKSHEVREPGVCSGRLAEWTRHSLCLGGDGVVCRCIQIELSSVGNKKCFVPAGECPIFHSGQSACHRPNLAILLSMGAMFSPGRAALAKCYGLE